ncbi:MAG: nuclear transport factor 2 family protein [Tahibacter sp.]
MITVRIVCVAGLIASLGGCATQPKEPGSGRAGTERCKMTDEAEIRGLFERWNHSLQTGDPHKVVENYAPRSILLATQANPPLITVAEKEEYFHHFLENRPSGTIDFRMIQIGCNSAFDAGLYTFEFAATQKQVKARFTYTYRWDGKQWLITSHHSSVLPNP